MHSVLIVDDADFARNELKSMGFWGNESGFYIAAEARNGRDALQIMRRQSVDLLITDIRMPLIDGIALTQVSMKEKLCRCVILVSQFDSFDYARQAISHGAFEYLLKPLTGEQVLEALRRASLYIRERNLELMKIHYVDQVVSGQAIDWYPSEEFEALAAAVRKCGTDSVEIASSVVSQIWRAAEFDLLKAAFFLNRILHDIDGAVRKEFSWLGKLTRLSPRMIDFTQYKDNEVMRSVFLGYVGELAATVAKFHRAGPDGGIIKRACDYVLENIDAPVSLNSLAKKLYISNSYLSLLFKQKTGINLNSYITFCKMERSKILLEEGEMKSYEIAEKIGFSVEYFSKLFKKTYTISPMEYRRTL